MTSAQKAATLKKYDVRLSRLRQQLRWYKEHNHLYKYVEEQEDWETSLSTIATRVVVDQAHEIPPAAMAVPTHRTSSNLEETKEHEEYSFSPRTQNGAGGRPSCPNSDGTLQVMCLPVDEDAIRTGTIPHTEQTMHDLPLLGCSGGDALDNATWRHNAPAPAHHIVTEEDEVCEQVADGLITDFGQVDNTTSVQMAIDRSHLVVHRSSSILSDFDTAFWTNAFTDLFPYGKGGLDEPRDVKIGLQEFIKYCMRHSSRRFCQHRSFAMVAFDVLARHNTLQAIAIRARMRPGTMERSSSVSREQLQSYVQYQQDRLEAITQHLPPPPAPEIENRVFELYDNISTGLRSYWGSNEERTQARADLFSMQLKFGQPTIFFTISPDSSSTFRIANLAGVIDDDVLSHMEASVSECMAFTRAKLGQIAAVNPYICARYFDYLMNMFVNVVLNWNMDKGCPRDEPGLFGHTVSFFAATESQNSTGSLHAHMLIWIKNMPSTVDEYYAMCASERFRAAMVKYVEAISTANVPLDMEKCPSCENGTIKPLELQRLAFKKPRAGASRPATSCCDFCGVNFGADELIVKSCMHATKDVNGLAYDDAKVFQIIASSRPLPRCFDRLSEEAIVCSRALVYHQHHHWFHTNSCFKATKRTPNGDVCRMFMPKETCTETKWTPEDRIEIKRGAGNEYINPYSPIINALFKCNHDIKFLSAGEGPEKAYYTIKYSTKHQQSLENPWALHLHAFDKTNKFANDAANDPAAVGRRRVQSMCCTLSNPHEISAPMACLYIIKGSAMYSSHQFVKLPVAIILKALFDREGEMDVLLEGDNNHRNFKPSSIWLDYVYRPAGLDSVNLMTFAAEWSRKKSKKGIRFLEEHPLYESHSLFRVATERVVTVSHKRLPDTRQTDLPETELLRYQQTLMALFCPFRGADDFSTNGASLGPTFELWWATAASLSARNFVKNNLDYYVSRDLLKTQEDPESARYRRYESSLDDIEDFVDVNGDLESDDEDTDSDLHNNESDSFDEVVWAPTQLTRHIQQLAKSTDCVDLAASSTVDPISSVTEISMTVDDVEQVLQELKSSSPPTNFGPNNATLLSEYPDFPTRVQLLQQATDMTHATTSIENINYLSAPPGVLSGKEMPKMSLEQISLSLDLNVKQRKMFTHVGKKLLSSLLLGHDTNEQVIAFLGGKPGAGKSRVIGALQMLARTWDSAESVATGAYQGVAAQAANGQTIHKLFGWYVNNKKPWTPNQEQKERFARLKLLIIDEISTCDVGILGKIDASLRKLLDKPTLLFGGIHVLLVGDWLQQLPVAGQPAFLTLDEAVPVRRKNSSDYLDKIRGLNAYRSLNCVVILTDNMRHREDPVWKTMLDKWRLGKYDNADIDHVNNVAYDHNWTSRNIGTKCYCPIIVTSNALRAEFNSSALRAFCKQSETILHRFPATVSRPRHRLTNAQRRSLDCIRDDKTGGMSIVLEFAAGSMVQCTKNVSSQFKLANGSIGSVVAFTSASRDAIQVRTVNGIQEHHHSLPPDIVFVKLKDYPTRSFLPGLPQGVVPVCKKSERGVQVKLPDREFSISITQVPLVPAYCLTTEKCQGLTVEKMILGPIRHSTRLSPQRSSFYVAVTRVKSLNQLYLMSPLTKQFLKYFKPSANVLQETTRLEAMELP
ncbi:hypothetical protein PPTG_09710 [Phytophthora nicotianae INRA-310]|uniref:ATP-dependent DNA helicase n=1 Tax=Phytophthora nicotianae (strain INRA-310) TaxID=761204 RepID=W2QFW7_PHYN3|nr:hypothetical protein PPTG_09710 [Phytophthora nicotianae INRA-310]ETN12062.1 hypothetical protein PPTG_09710 [Phytophthora nicotianae INRA-310]